MTSSSLVVTKPPAHSKAAKHNPTKLKLSLPTRPSSKEVSDDGDWFWYEGKRIRRSTEARFGRVNDDEAEEEYDCGYLDLGAESPYSGASSPYFGANQPALANDKSSSEVESVAAQATGQRLAKEWAVTVIGKSDAVTAPGAATWNPGPSSRRGSTSGRKPSVSQRKKEADRDCGICFEYAVKPCRTRCCGKIFCREHLRDWLHGPNACGLCPNCDAPCSLDENTLSLMSPPLRSSEATNSHQPSYLNPQQYERLAGRHVPSSPLSTTAPITQHGTNSTGPKDLSSTTKRLSSSPSASLSAASHFTEKSGSIVARDTQAPASSSKPLMDKDCEAGWENGRAKESKPVNDFLMGDSKQRMLIAEEWGLPPASLYPKSDSGTSTPMWNSKALQGRKPSAFDSVFSSPNDTLRTFKHMAMLVALLMLLYFIVG